MLTSLITSLVVLLSTQNGLPAVLAQRATGRDQGTLAEWRSCRSTCLTSDALNGECEKRQHCSKERMKLSSDVTFCNRGLGLRSVCCPLRQQEKLLKKRDCGRLCRTTQGLYGTCQYKGDCPAHRRNLTATLIPCKSRWGNNGKICCPFHSSESSKPPPPTTAPKPSPTTTPKPKPTTPTTTPKPPPKPASKPPPLNTPPKPPPAPARTRPQAVSGPTTRLIDPPTRRPASLPKYPLKPQHNTNCGKTQRGSRMKEHENWLRGIRGLVIGGRPADPTAWPWIVVLDVWNARLGLWSFHCGGTLIDKWHVLTAAHCMDVPRTLARKAGRRNYDYSSERYLKVSLGVYNRDDDRREDRVRGVSLVIVHHKYKIGQLQNDVALLKLRGPVSFTKYVQPICLPAGPTGELTGVDVTVAGWGSMTGKDEDTNILREVTILAQNVSDCQHKYRAFVASYFPGGFGDTKLCASWPTGGRDACIRDSGGPLVVEGRNDKRFLVGIISGGSGCGLAKYPGIYTRVSAYLHWIRAKTKLLTPLARTRPFSHVYTTRVRVSKWFWLPELI